MTSQIKQQKNKTNAFTNVIIYFGIAIFALWVTWFICDCIFISNGLPKLLDPEATYAWDQQWYDITRNLAAVLLGCLGGYIALLVAFMVNCGLKVKTNMKQNIYLLITIAASFIAITICVIKASQMMINDKFVLSLTDLELYHLDYLKWMSIPSGVLIFSTILLLTAHRGFNYKTVIRDINLILIALACALVIATPFFAYTVGWHGNKSWLDDTWLHVVCQCITSPMGVYAGMVMVIVVARVIVTIFAFSNKLKEKKRHLIVFSILSALVFIAFIAAHVNKMDFEKLLFDYDSMIVGCILLVLAETLTAVAVGVYCAISHQRYLKRVE